MTFLSHGDYMRWAMIGVVVDIYIHRHRIFKDLILLNIYQWYMYIRISTPRFSGKTCQTKIQGVFQTGFIH